MRQTTLLSLAAAAAFVTQAHQPAWAQTPDLSVRGAYLVNGPAACGNCHTPKGADLLPVASQALIGGVKFNSPGFGLAISKNLTPDNDTGLGTWSEPQIVRAVREGVTKESGIIGPPMPVAYFNRISDDDIKAIAAYLRTIKPIRNEVGESKYKIEPKAQPPVQGIVAPPSTDKLAYGAYLVNMAHCLECHTPPGADGRGDFTNRRAAGGRPFFPIEGKIVRSANITSDKETGIGAWTDAEVKRAITEGISKDGRQLIPQMPYPFFRNLTPDDLDAVVAYIRTLPAVSNKNPPNPPLQTYLQ
jgi:mono/diheme cytochrome c family protein